MPKDNSLPSIIDRVQARGRLKTIQAREDERYAQDQRARGRAEEVANLEHAEKVETLTTERGARQAARLAAAPTPGQPAVASDGEQPEQLAGPPAEEGSDAPAATGESAAPAAAAPAPKPLAVWMRAAEAQRDYWTQQGRPERASKAMIDAYKNAFAQDEARYAYEIQPRQEALRTANLTAEELKADAKVVELQQASEMNQMHAAGKLWGLVKMGATREALDLFNASKILQPGVKAASIQVVDVQGPNGERSQAMVLMDKDGKPLKNSKGADMLYPVVLLEKMHEQSITSTMTLKPGESVVQVQRDPANPSRTRITPLHNAPNPTTQNAADRNKETLRQHGRQALKDRLFAGQTMMDKVDPGKQNLHGIAQPLVDQYVDAGMTPAAAVDKAVKEAEEQVKRSKAGAGPKSGGAPKPTVKDIIGG